MATSCMCDHILRMSTYFLARVHVRYLLSPVRLSVVLGVVLDQRLTFEKHATAVAKSCNYHAQAIRHIRHLLTLDLAQTLACSLILSRIDYCNALLHGAPAATIHKLQRVQNNAARIVVQAPKRFDANPLLRRQHWLLVEQRIIHKMAVRTFKIQNTATPAYLNRHLQSRDCVRNLRSSGTPLLARPSWKTDFAARGFRHSAPAVCGTHFLRQCLTFVADTFQV